MDVQLPDGTVIQGVPDGISRADLVAKLRANGYDTSKLAPQETPKQGFFPSMGQGARQYMEGIGQLLGMTGGVSGEAMRDAAVRAQEQEAQKVKSTSMGDVEKAYKEQGAWGGAKELGQLWKENIAASLPAMGGIMGGARLGAMAGSPLGPAGTIGGGILGGFVGAMPAQVQQMVAQQVEASPGAPIEKGAALAGAAGASALDVAEQFFLFGKTLGFGERTASAIGKLMGRGEAKTAENVLLKQSEKAMVEAAKVSGRGMGETLARGAGRGIVTEVPVEVAQQVIQRAQAGQELLSPDAMKEYRDTAITMVGPGAAFGAVGGAHGKMAAAKQYADMKKAQDTENYVKAKAEEERIKAEEEKQRLVAEDEAALPKIYNTQADQELAALPQKHLEASQAMEAARAQMHAATTPEETEQASAKVLELQKQVAGIESMAKKYGVGITPHAQQVEDAVKMLTDGQRDYQNAVRQMEKAKDPNNSDPEEALRWSKAALKRKQELEALTKRYPEAQRLISERQAAEVARQEGMQKAQEAEAAAAAQRKEQEARTAEELKQENEALKQAAKPLKEPAATARMKGAYEEFAAQQGEAKSEERADEAATGLVNALSEQGNKVDEALGVDPSQPHAERMRQVKTATEEADTHLSDLGETIDDLRKGVFFGGPNVAGASSTLAGLQNKARDLAAKYADAYLKEIALQRSLQNKPPLSLNDALKHITYIKQHFNKLIESATNYAGKAQHDKFQIRKLKQTLAKTTDPDSRAALEKRIAEIEDLLARREERTTAFGTQMADVLNNRMERELAAANKRGASQADKNAIFAKYRYRKERAIQRGVKQYEVQGWRQHFGELRGQLLKAEKKYTRIPGAGFQLQQQTQEGLEQREQALAGGKATSPTAQMLQGRQYVSDKLGRVLGMPRLKPEVQDVLQQGKDVMDANRGSRKLMHLLNGQADRIIRGEDAPFTPSAKPEERGYNPRSPLREAMLLDKIKEELGLERVIRTDTSKQRELFSEKQLPANAFARQTAAAFRKAIGEAKKFLGSKEVQRLRDAEKRRTEFSEQKLLDNLVAQMKEAPEGAVDLIHKTLLQASGLRKALQEQLRFELPQSVLQRLRATATALEKEAFGDLPGLDASMDELEASQPELAEVRERIRKERLDIAKATTAIGTWYQEKFSKYANALDALEKQVRNNLYYHETLKKSVAELEEKKAAERMAEARRIRAEMMQLEKEVDQERAAAAQLKRDITQRIGERATKGILGATEVTAVRPETYNKETGEKVIGPRRQLVRQLPTAAGVKERAEQRLKETARKVVEERAPKLYAKLKNELRATDMALDKAKTVLAVKTKARGARDIVYEKANKARAVYKEQGKTPPARFANTYEAALRAQNTAAVAEEEAKAKVQALEAQRKDVQARMDKLAERHPDVTWQPSRPPAAVSASAVREAQETLRKYGDIPATRMHASTSLRSGVPEHLAQKEASKKRREETRRKRRMEDFLGPVEEQGLESWELGDTGITIQKDEDGGVFRLRKGTGRGGIDLRQADQQGRAWKEALAKRGITFQYVPTVEDLPAGVKRVDGMLGTVTPDGRVFVVGENHNSIEDMGNTLTHEIIGHYGPDTILGKDGFKELSDRVWAGGEASVRKLADELGLGPQIEGILQAQQILKASPEATQLAVTRELVADTATYNMPTAEKDSLLNKVRNWITKAYRKALAFLGMPEKQTAQDIFNLLRESKRAFESKEGFGPYRNPAARAAFRNRMMASDYLGGAFGTGPDDLINTDTVLEQMVKTKGANLGLLLAQRGFDHIAAAKEFVRRVVGKGKLEGQNVGDLEANQVIYHLSNTNDAVQHTANVVTHGGLGFVAETKNGKTTYTWGGKRFGPGMEYVLEPLRTLTDKPNDLDAIGKIATYYGLLQRGKSLGFEKFKTSVLDDPAQYNRFMANKKQFEDGLKANPKVEAALEQWFKRYQEYNHGLLDMMAATHALPKATVERLKKLNNYIPAYRLRGDGIQMLVDEKWHHFGDVSHQPELKQLLGGDESIMPFFDSAMRNTHMIVNKALNNKAAMEFAMLAQDMGAAKGGVQKGYGPATGNVVNFNVEPKPGEIEELGEENAGKRHIVIDAEQFGLPTPLVMEGLRGVSMQMPWFLQMLKPFSRLVRSMVMMNPMYAVRQLYSDVPSLMFTSGAAVDVGKAVKDVTYAAKALTTGKESDNPTIARLREMGMMHGNLFAGTKEDLARVAKEVVGGQDSWSKLLMRLNHNAMIADSTSRAHIFDSLKAQGLSDMEAALAVRQAVDFNQHGASPGMRMMASVMPFFNTQMQSLYSLGRAMTGKLPFNEQLKIKQKFWTRGLMLMGLSLAYAASKQDDKEYQDAPEAEKLYYWFVPVPGLDQPLRVRVPFEAGVLFKSFPEAMYRYATGNATGKEALGGAMKTALNSNPFGVPPLVKLAIEQGLNVSTFTGMPLEDSQMQKLDPDMRYRRSTSETAKALGKEFGLSPVRMENLINTLTTGTGMALFTAFDPLVRNMKQEVAGEVKGDISKFPIIGTAFQPSSDNALLNQMMDMSRELERRANTYNQLVKLGRKEEAKAYAAEYLKEIGLGTAGGLALKVDKQVAGLKQMEKAILEAPESRMSPEEKREKLDKIKAAQRRIAAEVRQTYLRAGI